MTNKLTRRTALAGAAALPLAGVAGANVAPALHFTNATDAAWAALEAAQAHYNAEISRLRSMGQDVPDNTVDGVIEAENAVMATPAETLVDLERKMMIESPMDQEAAAMLADLRRVMAKGGA